MENHVRMHHGYMSDLDYYGDPSIVVGLAESYVKGVANCDTLVGRGMSGALVIPMVAWALNLNYVIIRKPNDNAHTSRHVGTLGHRWLFVDDFLCTGETRRITTEAVSDIVLYDHNVPYGFTTQYVGTWCYAEHTHKDHGLRLTEAGEIVTRV